MNERLKILFNTTRKKQVEFAKLLYKNSENYDTSNTEEEVKKEIHNKQSYVSGLINGSNKIGTSTIMNILKLWPNLNLNWFILGKGEMFTNEIELGMVAEPPEQYGQAKSKTISILANELNIKNQEIERLLGIIEKLS